MKISDLREQADFLERLFVQHYKLERNCLSKMEEDEDFKTIAINYINGFGDSKLTCYSEIENEMKMYGLDIKNIHLDTSLEKEFRMIIESLVYIHKGFIIRINIKNDYDELFKFIKHTCDRLDKYFNDNVNLSSSIIYASPDRYQVSMFNIFAYAMNTEDMISFGKNLYLSSDYGANNLDEDLIEQIFSFKGNYNGSTLRVYRGVGSKSKSLEDAYAWTTDINVAKFFATRFISNEKDLSKVKVYQMDISVDDILSIIDGAEKEVIVKKDRMYDYIYDELIEEVEFDNTKFYEMPTPEEQPTKTLEEMLNDESEEDFLIAENLLKLL